MIGWLAVAQLAVISHAPGTATVCTPFTMTVAARAGGAVAPVIALPPSSARMQLLRSTVVSRVEADGMGRPSALTEATFTLATRQTGAVVLPSILASVGEARVRSTPRTVDVRAASSSAPLVMVRAWLGRAGTAARPDTLYVGQQADYVVDVHLNEAARLRLRRNPTFFPPEMPGVLAYDIAPPPRVNPGLRCFETLSYRRAVFPLFAGQGVIAPATLSYALPLSTSFFSREENVELRTDSVRFVAADPPMADRPRQFAGAVGTIAASTRLSVQSARMGDPVVVTLRLEGAGNVKLWPRPPLAVDWATLATGVERVQVDSAQATVRGAKEFDWLVTPLRAGQQTIPPLEYVYFDPSRRSYAVARTAPLVLEVAPASLAVADVVAPQRLEIRRSLGEEASRPLIQEPWYWLLLAFAPLPTVVRRAHERRTSRGSERSARQRFNDSVRGSEPPRHLRRLYLDAMRERVPQLEGLSNGAAITRHLRRAGVTDKTAMAAGFILDRLEVATFSPSAKIDAETVALADSLIRAVDEEAIKPSAGRSAIRVWSFGVLLVGSASLLGAVPQGLARTWQEGVRAHDAAQYAVAERLFARATVRAPRAMNAWMNLGAVAWTRGDSATAVRAWQRAIRIDPTDAAVRRRLTMVRATPINGPAYVPPISQHLFPAIALVCWLSAWTAMAVPPSRRHARVRPLAGAAAAAAIATLAAALEINDRFDSRQLAVLRAARPLVDAPGSATATASALTGETGSIGAREGPWVHVTMERGRAGWVPVASLLPLDGPPVGD